MADRPTVLVTRRLTDAVHARLEKDYIPLFNLDDRVFSKDELISHCQSVDAVIPYHSEHFSAEVIAALPARCEVATPHRA
jgi:hypothetical protein